MSNTLTNVIPQILAMGLKTLREYCVMPRMVNTDYSTDAKQKGSTIDIPIPSAITVQNVTPAATPPSTADIAPSTVQIALDTWKEAPFYLTDKDRVNAINGVIPMQVEEAIKALANTVNASLFALYVDIYGFSGIPGTTPFASNTKDATDARTVLTKQLAPKQDRRFVLDPDAEGNALNLRAFQDVSWGNDPEILKSGNISAKPKFGFNWATDQVVPSHTTGTEDNAYTTDTAGYAIGVKTLTTITGSGTITKGDIFTIAGDDQTYVCTTAMAAAGALAFEPALKVAIAGSATAITVKTATHSSATSYVQNLAFHRDAFAFVSRPLSDQTEGLGNMIQSVADPVSGIALRVEVSREHKRTRWSFDILYGVKTIRRELATRLYGG